MTTGVQFNGSLPPNATRRWFTRNWAASRHVVWYVVPTTPRSGAPQIEWDVEVECASSTAVTYWITVKNLTSSAVNVEARYAILNA